MNHNCNKSYNKYFLNLIEIFFNKNNNKICIPSRVENFPIVEGMNKLIGKIKLLSLKLFKYSKKYIGAVVNKFIKVNEET